MAVSDRTTKININLNDEGIQLNSWITLEGAYSRIGLYSNNNIFVSPQETQFYFATPVGLVFVRHTKGKPELLEDGEELPEGYVMVPHNNRNYKLKLYGGGIKDDDIGVYHEVYSVDNIVGFFK